MNINETMNNERLRHLVMLNNKMHGCKYTYIENPNGIEIKLLIHNRITKQRYSFNGTIQECIKYLNEAFKKQYEIEYNNID